MHRTLCAIVLALSGCKADTPPPTESTPLTAEEQLRAELRGNPDAEVRAVSDAMASALSDAERARLAERDYAEPSGSVLLQDGAFMHGWGVVATELVGVSPRHLVEHPPCADVESVLAGWATGAGSILREELGTTIAGVHAPAVILFLGKKTAQSWRATVDRSFEDANHCATLYAPDGGVCGAPGGACCEGGGCFEGASCVGGLCL